jgi:mono/diheme cytochrome c family protein
VVALLLAGCDAMPGRPRAAERHGLPSQVTDFSVLYGRHCAGCHGRDGRLGAARPLNDPVYLAVAPPDRLRRIVAEGVRGTAMPAFAEGGGGPLTDAQIGALVRDLVARWGRPGEVRDALPPYDAEDARAQGSAPGDPERGRAVYGEACARCHGPDGTGGERGGSVVDATYLALVSDQALRTTVIAGRSDLGKPDWRESVPGRPLTPQQISDVVAWLAGKRRPVEGRPAVSAGTGGRPRP